MRLVQGQESVRLFRVRTGPVGLDDEMLNGY